MTIHVTQEDIENGERYSCLSCPITRAMVRETGQEWIVRCVTMGMPLMIGGFVVALPATAIEFIDHFDRGDPVRPFSFNISAECAMR